jgi:hypothetical protein
MAESFSLSDTYYPGASFQLYDQQPPEEDLDISDNDEDNRIENTYGRLHGCRVHSIWPPPDSSSSFSITLSSPLSIGVREHLSQVWKVSATPSAGPLVARIYDALYYDDPEGLVVPFFPIDRAVSVQTAAYHLLQPVQGDLVPRFKGLYLCPIPNQQRTVYVILLEYIDGEDLKSVRRRGLCERHKDTITEMVVVIWARVRSLGVIHNDTKPRNFILRSVAGESATSIEHTNHPQHNTGDEGGTHCSAPNCSLHSGADAQDLRIVMIDLEDAEIWTPMEPWDHDSRERELARNRPHMKGWLDK